MADVMVRLESEMEARMVRFRERPMTFDEFLDISEDPHFELVNGVMEERMAAQLEHEKLQMWLSHVIAGYVEKRGLGIVLGSRTAVETGIFGGRLPDLLFVRQERLSIVQEKAVYGAPDLILEIVSPNDRRSHIIALETDYRNLGVAEIVFINRQRRSIRVLRRNEDGSYREETLTSGNLTFATLPDLALPTDWLFEETRPLVYDLLVTLLSPSENATE